MTSSPQQAEGGQVAGWVNGKNKFLNRQEKHPISTADRACGHSRAAPWSSRHTAQTRARGEHVPLRWKVRKKEIKIKC